jgi:hypothetical protein
LLDPDGIWAWEWSCLAWHAMPHPKWCPIQKSEHLGRAYYCLRQQQQTVAYFAGGV